MLIPTRQAVALGDYRPKYFREPLPTARIHIVRTPTSHSSAVMAFQRRNDYGCFLQCRIATTNIQKSWHVQGAATSQLRKRGTMFHPRRHFTCIVCHHSSSHSSSSSSASVTPNSAAIFWSCFRMRIFRTPSIGKKWSPSDGNNLDGGRIVIASRPSTRVR